MITTRSGPSSVLTAVAGAVLVVTLAGCGSSAPEGVSSSPTPRIAEATLGPATSNGPGRTYNPALAPEGASLRAELAPDAGGTRVTLAYRGLVPNRSYAAHAHSNPCGPTGEAAGPHYQNNPDPMATDFRPSTDPAYANPQNEIWLELRTDGSGSGTAATTVPWPTSNRGPQSIVVHEAMQTMTGPGVAGTAGGRIACMDLR